MENRGFYIVILALDQVYSYSKSAAAYVWTVADVQLIHRVVTGQQKVLGQSC